MVKYASETEGQLTARCLAGDDSAAELIYRAHTGRVVGYFLRSGFSHADADDLAQDVFMRALKSLATFDPARGRLSTWLGAIARNVARKRWSRRTRSNLDPELADEMFAAPDADSPESLEETAAVSDCVADLPDELQRIVRLRYVDGLATRGIADAMGMPEATVRLRLGEARGAIERCLKAKGIIE